MRVLSISSDKAMFDAESVSAQRQVAYGDHLGTLDIIVFSLHRQASSPIALSPNVHVYPTASRSRLFYSIDALRLAKKLEKPEVVTVQDPFEAGIVGRLIARRFNLPLHVQVHTDFLAPAFSKLSYLNRARVMIAGFVLRRAKRIRVVSERVRKNIEERYHLRGPITVLPIFVNVEKHKTTHTRDDLSARFARFNTKLLIVSRLEPEKNVELSIESFASATPQDACLIIVGDGGERRKLEHLVASHNLGTRVFFEGRQNSEAYYKLADLTLVTSWYEGYGRTIIESLASGVPVLATDVGIAREVGAIVTTEDQFASALAAWFQNGPRTGELKNYPYTNFDEYVQAYCKDIETCMKAE